MRRIYVVLFIISIAANIYFVFRASISGKTLIEVRYQRDLLNKALADSKNKGLALSALAAKKEMELSRYKDSTDLAYKTSLTNTQKYYETQLKKIRKYNVATIDSFFKSRYPSPGVRSRQHLNIKKMAGINVGRRFEPIRSGRFLGIDNGNHVTAEGFGYIKTEFDISDKDWPDKGVLEAGQLVYRKTRRIRERNHYPDQKASG